MTREEAKKLLPIIQAYTEGKTIQYRVSPSFPRPNNRDISYVKEWFDIDEDKCDGFSCDGTIDYRIKPELKYRPFKNQEECAKEMINHTPFGIITDGVRDFEIAIYPNGIYILDSLSYFYPRPFSRILKEYKFADGIPFGIKEE